MQAYAGLVFANSTYYKYEFTRAKACGILFLYVVFVNSLHKRDDAHNVYFLYFLQNFRFRTYLIHVYVFQNAFCFIHSNIFKSTQILMIGGTEFPILLIKLFLKIRQNAVFTPKRKFKGQNSKF